ncbi:MAG: efflux RND transporter periplasmic adaptor subunit [Opitutales bacterium]
MKIILPILILLGAGGIYFLLSKPEKAPAQEPEPLPPRRIETMIAEAKDLNLEIESQGFVRPRAESRLSAEISGKVVSTSASFYAGEFVEAGEVLVELESLDYEAALSRARARVAQEALALAEEEARAEQAGVDWKRLNEGPASALTLREPQLENVRANLAAAEADLAQAKRNLERTQIRAPFDALVKSREVSEGQYLNPGAAVGMLYAIDFAEVRLPILSKDLPFLSLPEGSSVSVSSVKLVSGEDGAAIAQPVSLVRTENVIDEANRVLYAVARVEDPYARSRFADAGNLRIGSFVTAFIDSMPLKQVYQLPRIALRGSSQLAVVSEESAIEIREIELLYVDEDYIYIRDGLRDGERVCLTSPQSMYAGTRVEWTEED